MARSQNGWPVLDERPPSVPIVPGVALAIKPGDVAWLLARVARFVHEHVEPLNTPVVEGGKVLPTDDWGWAKRPIRDQETGYSNHASATAIDLNATQHRRGVRRTWTTAERAAIDRHLAEYEGTVRWGEHYQSTIDGMHFEIIGTESQVRRVRVKLQELDAERARQEQEADMPTAAEIAQAVVNAPVKLMRYVDIGLGDDPDDTKPLGELVQHAAGQAAGAVRALAAQGRTLASLASVVSSVQVDVRNLQAAVERLENPVQETPPADGAGG
jgi:hypothetical protein